MADLNLDVDAPDQVPNVLRLAAESFNESAAELATDWQSPAAGRPWRKIAKKFERLADDIERMLDSLNE